MDKNVMQDWKRKRVRMHKFKHDQQRQMLMLTANYELLITIWTNAHAHMLQAARSNSINYNIK